MELAFDLRVRDLVHGYVYLTADEVRVLNHPLFGRLRHIRQNDVAFLVYPSLNISRFEHSLGCAHVAGRMLEHMRNAPRWDRYCAAVGLADLDVVRVGRLYALLHDVGHLPLSHLFEFAFDDYAAESFPDRALQDVCAEWFGVEGFAKLHEACGAAIAKVMIPELDLTPAVGEALLRLLTTKKLAPDDPLRPLKQLVDSEVDADRIDATARDGLLAGGEYGRFDTERLASATLVIERGSSWTLAYSDKAIGSLEALLFDRYRTHTWIHFHHRVVAMKVAAFELIRRLLTEGRITPKDFPIDQRAVMALRDDVWLWSLLRDEGAFHGEDGTAQAARRTLLYRDNTDVRLLWKNRAGYHDLHERLRSRAEVTEVPRFLPNYDHWLTEALGVGARTMWLPFKPTGAQTVWLTDDRGAGEPHELAKSSLLVASLARLWSNEVQYYLLLFGGDARPRSELEEAWLGLTSDWINRP